MPTLPSVPRVVRVDWHFTVGADVLAQCRSFFQYTGALSQVDAQAWCTAAKTAWVARMIPNQNQNTVLSQTALTDLSSLTAPQVVDNTTATGSIVGNAGPAGMALVIKRKLNRRYRGGHSRLYMPGPAVSNLATIQTWSAGYQSTMATAFNNLVSDILTAVPLAAGPATEVSVSYFSGFTNHTYPTGRTRPLPTPRVTPIVDLVVSHSVNPKVGTQRRRNLQ